MKNKYIDAIFMVVLLCILTSLSFLGPSLVNKMSSTEKTSFESPTFMEADEASTKKSLFEELDTMTQQEKNMIAREAHSKYPHLVDAMLNLRRKGFLTYEDIMSIHTAIDDYEVDQTTEVPYTDKDLLDYLYDNNIITKAQLEQILDFMDEEDW